MFISKFVKRGSEYVRFYMYMKPSLMFSYYANFVLAGYHFYFTISLAMPHNATKSKGMAMNNKSINEEDIHICAHILYTYDNMSAYGTCMSSSLIFELHCRNRDFKPKCTKTARLECYIHNIIIFPLDYKQRDNAVH